MHSLMPTYLPPVFFSSIPKCGKNLIYSFFFALGYKRFQFKDVVYNSYSNLQPFYDLKHLDHYLAERKSVNGIDPDQDAQDFCSEICSMPSGYIGHRHMHADPVLLDALGASGIRPIFIYRDPRDCLVSAVHWAAKGKPEHVARQLAGMSEEEAILALLSGDGTLVPFARWFDAYRAWLGVPGAVILRFEDIIGSRGGGSDTKQRECLGRAVKALGIEVPEAVFDAALAMAFNPRAGTFRNGQIGGWQQTFSLKISHEFNQLAGQLPNLWGYGL